MGPCFVERGWDLTGLSRNELRLLGGIIRGMKGEPSTICSRIFDLWWKETLAVKSLPFLTSWTLNPGIPDSPPFCSPLRTVDSSFLSFSLSELFQRPMEISQRGVGTYWYRKEFARGISPHAEETFGYFLLPLRKWRTRMSTRIGGFKRVRNESST